jgi:ABC-type lipoprotein release transport system permease subunit
VPGVVSSREESANIRVVGFDSQSSVAAPYRDSVLAGSYLDPDERDGALIGRRLATELGVAPGDSITLALVDGNGNSVDASFEVRGVFGTGIPSYDDGSVMIPLERAQGMADVGDRASAVVIQLDDEERAAGVAAALGSADVRALTWTEINELILETLELSMSFYLVLDLIVMLVVAVVIANTLLMAVFERVREIGILASLGLKRRQIMTMVLMEASILGVCGIVLGLILGLLGVVYLARVGLPVSEQIAASAGSYAMGTVMKARFVPGLTLGLAVWTLIVILLAALYPARFASRLEPVEALHRT